MAYTIRIREQVVPKYTQRPGPGKIVERLNPVPIIPPPSPGATLIWSDLSGIYEADPAKRLELWEDPQGLLNDAAALAECPALKVAIIDKIKQLRAVALDKATRSPGVSAIYAENYFAAVEYQAGRPESLTKAGMTAEVHLTGLAANLNMTAPQFADYIIKENRRVGPPLYDIEGEYTRLAYAVIPLSQSIPEIMAAPAQFQQFCGL
ncbi:hypothetical protein KI809_18740 [Geobacter pelophilus]|uniref:Uncharacterized protein n=1 Tax=Geoanaerobacter pelophilus TaxID=60036 RepID=A0AAW4L9T3_9BACT|nr:hypothetical protein [Geoanaerobacter pelophilus]MBT0666350.1 hypothetical protein [Geoanaerobacter pelophilus]